MKLYRSSGYIFICVVVTCLILCCDATIRNHADGQDGKPVENSVENEVDGDKVAHDDDKIFDDHDPGDNDDAAAETEMNEETGDYFYRVPDMYQLKLTLTGIMPLIWRRIIVEDTYTCSELADAIMGAFGWHGYHLYMFVLEDETIIGDKKRDPTGLVDFEVETTKMVDMFAKGKRKRLKFIYDFIARWTIRVRLEKIIPGVEDDGLYTTCIDGEMAGPPDDIGGVPGYKRLLSILKNPDHPEFKEQLKWLDYHGYRHYNPVTFNASECGFL